ncbi:MAG: 4-alpha-glucanotransferase [Clostridia bacterium]|nr:4-alpha-glucanotransferase [Clostridia bacterium]
MKDYTKNFGFSHKCGILMPISALPSPYGIGSFGKSAYEFVDFLSATGQKCWQVLPLNPTSYGDSPYQSPASASGNPYFIDLDMLAEDGLLTKAELKEARDSSKKINYGALFEKRYAVLRTAYSRFTKTQEYRSFVKKERAWLDDYALFMALKLHYSYKPWTEWSETHKNHRSAVRYAEDFREEMDFWRFLQYEFDKQWQSVRDYAHSRGILIIGDMPIYVAHDSMDVWASPENFLLDEDFMPITVAGCPPDAYSEDGQLWGNPIYNWERMTADGFSWWCARVGRAFRLYDILRIDHFRGFASFYSIPYGDENAKRGRWVSAPGTELFEKIKKEYPRAKIIAEDLGFITDDVRELLKKSGFPGMKLLQFAFFEDDNEYLPRTYTTKNCVVYTASHDSDCTRSWAVNLRGATRARFLRECPREDGETSTHALIRLAMGSRGNLVVIPIQDYLELTNAKGRMNTPSVPYGNWAYRLPRDYDTEKLRRNISEQAKNSGRFFTRGDV